jgi:hypothetical protein
VYAQTSFVTVFVTVTVTKVTVTESVTVVLTVIHSTNRDRFVTVLVFSILHADLIIGFQLKNVAFYKLEKSLKTVLSSSLVVVVSLKKSIFCLILQIVTNGNRPDT